MLFKKDDVDTGDVLSGTAADNSGSSGQTYTGKSSCVPLCYTVGQGVTSPGDGTVYTEPLNISWAAKCKFYGEIRCSGCVECQTSPPPSPPASPPPAPPVGPSSPIPPPPTLPPIPPSSPPSPPFTYASECENAIPALLLGLSPLSGNLGADANAA